LVATVILQQERADALDRLTHTLAGLDGVDEDAVREMAQRAAVGQAQVGQDYLAAQFLAAIADVLAAQQERIAALEAAQQTTKRGASKSKK
jgi:hypothetical protein